MAPTGKRDSSSTSGEPFDVKDLTPYSASAPMLSSGVETQPVPLDSSMSAVAQELHSELPVSVSKELHGDSEPSGIPDVKPGTSRAPVSQSRTVPLEQQRTPVESCCEEENAETSDDGGELGWCGLVDSTEGGSVASGILDRKGKPKSMELKVFRDQGTQEEVIVRPTCEGAKAEPSQHSTAAEDKMSPSQLQKDGSLESTLVLVQELTSVTGLKEAPTPGTPSAQTEELLLMQTRKELLCAGLPEDFLRSKGNTQITADTLLKSTAKVQGMKVSETKLDNRHGSVSKGPTPGSIEYPEVDSITTSSEVSERSPLASREPSMPVHSGSTEGACKEKQCEALKPCPSPLSLLPGNSAISKVDSGKEELCQVSLVWEADDSHRHILGCHAEKHHSPPGSPLAPRSAVAVEPLDENDRISSFTSSSSHGESRTTSPCDVEGNGLMKGSTEKTATSSFHQDDQSKNLASREENGGQFLSPGNEQELHSPVNSKQPEEGGSGHHSGCSGDSPKANTPSNNSVLGSDHKESSASLTPSSADATGVELKEKDLKITSDVQGSLTAHEDHRENSAHVGHPHRQYEESRLFLLVENEEPEWAATVAPRVLKEKIHNKDSTSLVSIVPAGQVSPGNEVSKARSDTGWLPPPPELDSKSESGKTAQTPHAGTPRVGEQSMACEVTEPPPPEGLVVNKVDCECVLNQQVSLNSRDHMKLPTDSPLKTDKEVPQTTSKDFHHSELEDRAHIVADAHIIPIKTKMKDISPPRHKTWRASSDSSTLTLIKPGLLEREGVAGSDVYSKNKVAGFPHESSAVECQNVESQEKYSGHCVNKNVSKEDTCSTCTTAESSAIILEDENSLIKKCEDTFQHNEPHSQGTENAMEGSTANVSYTLEEREPDGREAKGSLQEDNIREEATAGTSANGAPDKISSTTIHIGHSEEGLEGKGQNSPEKTVFCECNISNCTTHGLNQSANIPTPGKLLDQSPNLTFSTFENKNQEETQDQKADEALNCQSNQNRPAGWRKEHVTAKETQGSETVRASNSNKSHNQKDVLAGSTACGSPKKDDLEGSFENALGYEDSTIGMVDAVHTDCCNKPAETVLGRKVCTVDLDSDFPNAPSSTEESLKKDKSCKDKVCKSLENCKIALCADSGAPEVVVSVTDHEPEKRTLGQVDVSFNHVPREKLVQGPSQREPQEMDEGPRQDLNSELAKENSLGGISSKQSVSPRCQDENSVPLGSLRSIERMPSSLSPPENSETDVTDPLGRETDLKIVFKPKEGEIICENAKGFTVLPKIQEGAQRSPRSLSEGASMYMKKDRSEGCQPDTRLTLALEAEAKTKEDSREHQGPRQGHLTFGGESEMTAQEDDPFGSMCKISQTHMKCNRTHSVAEEQPHQEALDSRLKREEEYKHQKRIHGILEQRTSSNTLSDKLQNKSLSEEESAVLEEIALAKLTRDDIAAWARSLNAPKVGSSCHSFKKDVVLCAGRSFPGTPQKAQDPHSAGRGEILGTFGNPAPRTQGLPLKKQPHRTCKRAPCQDQVKVGRKTGKIRSSTFLMSSSEAIPTKEPRLDISGAPPLPARVESKSTPRSLPGHIPKQKAAPCHLSRSLDPRKPTKESALLSKLAILARKLAPDTKTQKLRYWRCSSELLPVARSYKRLRYKRFLDGFSRNTLQLNPYLAASRWDKTPNSKPVALYSLEAIRMNFIDLSSKMPSLLLGTDTHPVCFHVNSGLDSMAQASVTFPEHCAPTRLALGEAPRCSSQPPKWTFSFFFSHGGSGTATFREDTSLQSRTCPRAPPAPLASVQDSGSTTVVQSTAGFSVLGLHTLLALCSPGCYRIWTKKRSFSNHTTTMQRLFMTQFKQGLKGLRSPASIADKVFSLPYSVGRVLSIWSQHGPPGCPLEISALHSRHSKWQPSLQTSLVTTSRLEPPFSALVPKSRLVTGTPVSKLLLSASEFQVSGFDELDGVTAVCPRPQSPSPEQKEAEPEKRPKKVSQIRIRKTIPKPDPNLTPMGLPRPKRLKKKEFSLEEIYTNKNYKSPPANRCLETIFEEPKERNGTLISISQQKRKRVLEFQDFTVPRKRRARGKVKVAGSFTRAQKAALQSQELDALLIQKLMELETFFAKEEEQEEQASSS